MSDDKAKREGLGRFGLGVAALLLLLGAVVVGCADDSPAVTPLPSTTTTRGASPTSVTTTTTRPPITTTTSLVAPEEREYVRELLRIERRAFELLERVEQINEEWDTRTTGLSVTDQALVEAVEEAQQLKTDFDQIRHPNLDPFVTHTKVGSAVSRLHAEIERMLEGLRSPDAGEARQEALAVALETRTQIEAGIDRAAADVGYSEPPNRNPVTTTTTRLSPTTTGTTRTRRVTTTTTISDAQAEAICRADPDCILAAFAVTIAELTAILGATLDQAVELATGACDLLDAGMPWALVLAEVVIDPVLTEEESMAGAGIMGAGVNAFCPEHWWQVEEFGN